MGNGVIYCRLIHTAYCHQLKSPSIGDSINIIISITPPNDGTTTKSCAGSTYLGEFVLHVSEDEQKAADGVPQSAVSQSQLISGAWTL